MHSNVPARVNATHARAAGAGKGVPRIWKPKVRARAIERILVELMDGKSLRKICALPGLPNMRVVTQWLLEDPEFSERYYMARRVQAEIRADEIMDIADSREGDYRIVYDRHGNPRVEGNSEHFQRSRIRIDARKWFATKLAPKIYGDKVQNNHEVVGDLKELLTRASNRDSGLPPPIDGECEDVSE